MSCNFCYPQYLVPIEVGYEFPVYTLTEGTGIVSICTVVMNFPGGSPRPFTLNSRTKDGVAGRIHVKYTNHCLQLATSFFSIWP